MSRALWGLRAARMPRDYHDSPPRAVCLFSPWGVIRKVPPAHLPPAVSLFLSPSLSISRFLFSLNGSDGTVMCHEVLHVTSSVFVSFNALIKRHQRSLSPSPPIVTPCCPPSCLLLLSQSFSSSFFLACSRSICSFLYGVILF